MFHAKIEEKIKTHTSISIFFQKIKPLMRYCGKNGTARQATYDNTIRRMCFATMAIDTHSEYATLIPFHFNNGYVSLICQEIHTSPGSRTNGRSTVRISC